MPTQTLGKVKLTPRGAYDPAAAYVPLDIVSYGGGSYCVLKNVTGVTPTGDDVNYQLLAESGADGKSPQISASKMWLVWDAEAGEYVDTGVSAAGEKGDPGKAPIIGSNGNWYEWDETAGAYTDTGKPSRGEKGNTGAAGADGNDGRDGTDGITPTIGENGNWYLGATDTGKPSRGAEGATGATGATGEKGTDGKSAYLYAVEGGYTGTEGEFAAKLAEEMPDKLPNPNALTFTGAVTGSYDGSAPVSVEIPSGGGSGSAENWRLVNTVTTAEDVADIRITQDSAGNPLSLKKVKIFAKVRGNSASLAAWCRITVNNLTNNFYCDLQNTFAAKEGQDYYNYARADFAIYAGRLMLELLLRSANNSASKNTLWWVNNSGCFENYPDVVGAITSIRIWSASAGIGAGTELKIYGVDA